MSRRRGDTGVGGDAPLADVEPRVDPDASAGQLDHNPPFTPTARRGGRVPRRRVGRGRRRVTRTPAAPEPDVWSTQRILALGATTDMRTAARIFGLSANTAYDLARRDRFPVPVIRAGRQYRVSVPAILAVLAATRPDPTTT